MITMPPRFTALGSPPRVRGTVVKGLVKCLGVRITPACAGNRDRRRGTAAQRGDHPRVCGEQITPSPKIPCLTGSPPRVRGTVGCPLCRVAVSGITPACAGNSTHGLHMGEKVADHPRVCGEQEQGEKR